MKKNKNNSARADITVLPIVPGTVILSALMLLAFLILLIALNLGGMISLPHWIERILGTTPNKGTEEDRFSQEFLEALAGEERNPTEELLYIEADPQMLLNVLLQTESSADFYQRCTVTQTADNSTSVRQITRVVSGSREFAEVLSGGTLIKAVTANADAICITEGAASRTFARRADSVFTTESEIGIPSFSRMQKMLAEAEIGKYEITLSSTQDAACIRLEFTDTRSGTREIYEILPDYGLVFAATSYLPGADMPYYVMSTESLLTDITGFDESIFDMPTP